MITVVEGMSGGVARCTDCDFSVYRANVETARMASAGHECTPRNHYHMATFSYSPPDRRTYIGSPYRCEEDARYAASDQGRRTGQDATVWRCASPECPYE